MKVISINDEKEKDTQNRKEEIIKILDNLKEQVESGEVTEFVASSLCKDGAVQLYIASFDVFTAVGMFEVGKNLVLKDFDLG